MTRRGSRAVQFAKACTFKFLARLAQFNTRGIMFCLFSFCFGCVAIGFVDLLHVEKIASFLRSDAEPYPDLPGPFFAWIAAGLLLIASGAFLALALAFLHLHHHRADPDAKTGLALFYSDRFKTAYEAARSQAEADALNAAARSVPGKRSPSRRL